MSRRDSVVKIVPMVGEFRSRKLPVDESSTSMGSLSRTKRRSGDAQKNSPDSGYGLNSFPDEPYRRSKSESQDPTLRLSQIPLFIYASLITL